ncbi:MAG TPA: hypothetical protein VGI43_12675 [Mucilaginibacter sp.]|jgi:hypothetical protein
MDSEQEKTINNKLDGINLSVYQLVINFDYLVKELEFIKTELANIKASTNKKT